MAARGATRRSSRSPDLLRTKQHLPDLVVARLLEIVVPGTDGAMWRRTLFSHLTIDRELPALCRWPVNRILLTQIGRTTPPHEQLEDAVRAICPKAAPARDGMVVELPRA